MASLTASAQSTSPGLRLYRFACKGTKTGLWRIGLLDFISLVEVDCLLRVFWRKW